MKTFIALVLAVFASGAPYLPGSTSPSDRFGGWPDLTGEKTGFFHTQKIDGRWWLVTPDGNAFF